MPKQTGIPVVTTIQDSAGTPRDVSTDIRNFSVNNSANLLESTGLDKSAIERLTGLVDVEYQMNGVCNFDANKSHAVLSNFHLNTGSGREIVIDYGPVTITFTARFESYNITRGDDGSLTWQATGRLSSGNVPVYS